MNIFFLRALRVLRGQEVILEWSAGQRYTQPNGKHDVRTDRGERRHAQSDRPPLRIGRAQHEEDKEKGAERIAERIEQEGVSAQNDQEGSQLRDPARLFSRGARTERHCVNTTSTPSSRSVGTFGKSRCRRVSVTARARILPAPICGRS